MGMLGYVGMLAIPNLIYFSVGKVLELSCFAGGYREPEYRPQIAPEAQVMGGTLNPKP